MKRLIILIVLAVALSSCATTNMSGIGTDGKYTGPVVTGQHGEKMVIPNGGKPGITSLFNTVKGLFRH